MSSVAPSSRPLRLVRGSHIVLKMPTPVEADAYTLQDQEDRVVFVLPWLDKRFLIVGTTEIPERGDPAAAVCSAEEQAYLLEAYNHYFANTAPATAADVVWTWSGVRALQDDGGKRPSRVTRRSALATVANGTGGFVTLYGGKLTTHRVFAEDVLNALQELGAIAGGPWTKDVPLHGGSLSRDVLLALAGEGPTSIPNDVRRRWALTYGDQIEALYDRIAHDTK